MLNLLKVLFLPVRLLLYGLGYMFMGLTWCVRTILYQYYRFKKYVGWEIR